MLKQYGCSKCIHVFLASAGGAAHLADRAEGARGAHPLVPVFHRQVSPLPDLDAELARGLRALPLGPFRGEWEPHDHPRGAMLGHQLDKAGHRETAARTTREGLERRSEQLGLIRKGEANPDLAPIYR